MVPTLVEPNTTLNIRQFGITGVYAFKRLKFEVVWCGIPFILNTKS